MGNFCIDNCLRFFWVRQWFKNAPGTRTIIFPVSIPHIVHSRPISTNLLRFRPSPILCISEDKDSVFPGDRDSVCLEDRDCCCSQQEEFLCLQETNCYSSATRKSSPNPSYLRSGELVLPWDTKNRSSHTQIIHIEILRAQMYLKSDETEGTPPSEQLDILPKIDFWSREV